MGELTRISISLEKELVEAFDELTAKEGFPTRSEAIKSLLRKALVEDEWKAGGVVAGALVIVYDHHKHDLVHRLMHVQHDFGDVIISSQHVHLDHDNCLEMITIKGEVAQIKELVSTVRSIKGIKHTSLVMTTAGDTLP